MSKVLLHLVLSLVPPPHVAEQAVHDPHGPTAQSTNKVMIIFDKFNSKHDYQQGRQYRYTCLFLPREMEPSWTGCWRHTRCHCLMRLLFSPLTMCHREYYESLVVMYLVLSLVPSPHVAEQVVHDPHGPTSQSTKESTFQ